MRRRVVVWGNTVYIQVEQKSQFVWVARGEYLGNLIQVEDSTAATASRRWRDIATSKDNER